MTNYALLANVNADQSVWTRRQAGRQTRLFSIRFDGNDITAQSSRCMSEFDFFSFVYSFIFTAHAGMDRKVEHFISLKYKISDLTLYFVVESKMRAVCAFFVHKMLPCTHLDGCLCACVSVDILIKLHLLALCKLLGFFSHSHSNATKCNLLNLRSHLIIPIQRSNIWQKASKWRPS